ncbi:hypothetical protein KUCAC02_015782 [Chaenocephalus aceratus]|uniref:Uncharacterized protein n=1 Tax=Chaenocephalus aceratus TaxID=36190 RepID=A0ACB9XZT6_CHAAC|nr:hypothetical protein KUCAC02_015782 [Chaenocephalus aceratus]
MDIRTVVTISTLLLMTAESNQSTPGPNITEPPHTHSSTRGCSCPPIPSSPAPPTGLLSITWRSQCEGRRPADILPPPPTPPLLSAMEVKKPS